MQATNQNEVASTPAGSDERADAVRITVINNSQIISAVARTASLVIFFALVFGLVLRTVHSGTFKGIGKSFDIALIAAGFALLILSLYLEFALRRCPVCRNRITRKTEEKRRCLECDTELWGYWDE